MANKILNEEALKQVGKAGEARTYDVERGAIRRFAEAIEDRNPLFNDDHAARATRFGSMIAPPTFCRSMGSPIPDVRISALGQSFRGLDGSSEWEYFVPIRPGDRITVTAVSDAHLVLLGGAAMDGPRHIWWNFVSSRKERIEQAKADWKLARFDTVPGDDKEFIPLPA